MFYGEWVQNFVWNFKGAPWNFTQNFEPIQRKICILRGGKHLTTYDILKLWHLNSWWDGPLVSISRRHIWVITKFHTDTHTHKKICFSTCPYKNTCITVLFITDTPHTLGKLTQERLYLHGYNKRKVASTPFTASIGCYKTKASNVRKTHRASSPTFLNVQGCMRHKEQRVNLPWFQVWITSQGLSFMYSLIWLTHWGRVTHICVGQLSIIGSDNGLSPGRRQAIIWIKAGIL